VISVDIDRLTNSTQELLDDPSWEYDAVAELPRHGRTEDESEFVAHFVRRMALHGTDSYLNPRVHFELRTELLRTLSLARKRYPYQRKIDLASEHVITHAETYVGWTDLIERADAGEPSEYQFDRDQAWWARGEFRKVHEERRYLETKHSGEALERKLEHAGFRLMSQSGWRAHTRNDLMVYLMTSGSEDPLRWLAAMIRVYTTPRSCVTPEHFELLSLDQKAVGMLKSNFISSIITKIEHRAVAIPHHPMATLPKEANNLGMIAAKDRASHAGIKFHQDADTGQLSLLAYDRKLVLKRNDVPDTFIRIPLPKSARGETHSELDALLMGLRGLAKLGDKERRTHFQDIPRVVAGMFLAAAHDSSAGLPNVGPGDFWDSDTALRLTSLIGLNRSYTHHKKRVAFVREWLESIELERRIRTHGGEAIFQGPVVQRLKGTIKVSSDHAGDLRSGTYKVWRLDPDLWRLRNPQGESASFMLIDQRAFNLETRSSEPFNLYWAIVQRAYNSMLSTNPGDKVTRDGTFSPKVHMLYEWAGLEKAGDTTNPYRIRERMRDCLALMVDNGLLLDWSCPELEADDVDFSMEHFHEHMRVKLTLPTPLVRYLPERAFSAELASSKPDGAGA
jgi:hypothetical protein